MAIGSGRDTVYILTQYTFYYSRMVKRAGFGVTLAKILYPRSIVYRF